MENIDDFELRQVYHEKKQQIERDYLNRKRELESWYEREMSKLHLETFGTENLLIEMIRQVE